ncbi:MAG TPA: GAF domain-containing protein, partial [Smithellaceae bacterium]|nr:GAF domain-containing protein [Smithellaceae bacterium]
MKQKNIEQFNEDLIALHRRKAELEDIIAAARQTEEQLRNIQFDIINRNESLEAINAVTDKIYQSLDINSVAKEAVASMINYCQTTEGAIFEYREDSDSLDLLAVNSIADNAEAVRLTVKMPVEGNITGNAVREKRIIFCENIATDERIRPEVKKAVMVNGARSLICVPLLFQERVMGVMNLFFPGQYNFNDYELSTLLSIGKTIGL